jgi:hypothetical protein
MGKKFAIRVNAKLGGSETWLLDMGGLRFMVQQDCNGWSRVVYAAELEFQVRGAPLGFSTRA